MGSKLIQGINDLATVNPELAKEWHPTKNGDLLPSIVAAGSGKKVWWLGKCGHEWQAVVVNRNKGIGCPICVNQQILQGYNDLRLSQVFSVNSEPPFQQRSPNS
ncbi:zinc-ribbon domain-containing protein [bacterium]|nr:zinc-ribbon domain-containing protein [bacterium]